MKASNSKIRTKAKKVVSKDIGFRKGDFVVYPTHGVGRVLGVETQEISGHSLQVIIINFDKDRMTLRVPVAKAKNSGLRRLSTRSFGVLMSAEPAIGALIGLVVLGEFLSLLQWLGIACVTAASIGAVMEGGAEPH